MKQHGQEHMEKFTDQFRSEQNLKNLKIQRTQLPYNILNNEGLGKEHAHTVLTVYNIHRH